LAEANNRIKGSYNAAELLYLTGIVSMERSETRQAFILSGLCGEINKCLRNVDAHHLNSPSGELEGMTSWPTAHIEYSHSRRKMQFRDDEVDLLTRPFRERVPQVRRP
jgi:hypothetical protein